jgi:hypothetical protein
MGRGSRLSSGKDEFFETFQCYHFLFPFSPSITFTRKHRNSEQVCRSFGVTGVGYLVMGRGPAPMKTPSLYPSDAFKGLDFLPLAVNLMKEI